MTINENQLAKNVAAREGGQRNLSIGQIKEVVKLTLDELGSGPYQMSDVVKLVEKHQK